MNEQERMLAEAHRLLDRIISAETENYVPNHPRLVSVLNLHAIETAITKTVRAAVRAASEEASRHMGGASEQEPIRMPRTNDPDKARGLYAKFDVRRTNPESQARHERCDYFVLDLDHDALAIPALAAYESAAIEQGYNALAEDLRLKRAMLKGRTGRHVGGEKGGA